jgi:hypothetical protein
MALFIWSDKGEEPIMNSRPPNTMKETPPKPPVQAPSLAETSREGVTVRVSVLNDRHDEEEKEAGYGHGV